MLLKIWEQNAGGGLFEFAGTCKSHSCKLLLGDYLGSWATGWNDTLLAEEIYNVARLRGV